MMLVVGFNSLPSYQPPDTSHGDEFVGRIKQEIKVKKEPFDDLTPSTSAQPSLVASMLRSLTVEDEIARLRAQLPPIDYEAAELDTFEEYSTVDDEGDPVQCTCTWREVVTYLGDDEVVPEIVPPLVPPKIVNLNIVTNGESQKPEDSDEDETDDFCAVDDEEDVRLLPPIRGAVKSIFDPEYDANENLIEEMVRRKPRDTSSKVIEVKIDKGAVKPSRIEPLLMQADPIPETTERVPITNYVCEEDPMCPARAHFQRDPVTNECVERLHKKLINGVNGFWNGIPEDKPPQDFSKDMENIDYAKHQLWKRVVPRYDFLTCDKIPKTFDDGSPFSMPPPASELVDHKPSDGGQRNSDIEFREWHEVMNVRSYNDDVLTILPYVVID